MYKKRKQSTYINDLSLISNGFAAMGIAIPGALAAKMVYPKRKVVAATGDGGFMMMSQALSTVVRNKLNSVIFVMSNEVYAIEQAFVDVSAFSPTGEFAAYDELPKWDYQSLAEAYGLAGHKVTTCDQLRYVLERLQFEPEQAALVEVVIDKKDLAPAVGDLVKSINDKWPEKCFIPDHH